MQDNNKDEDDRVILFKKTTGADPPVLSEQKREEIRRQLREDIAARLKRVQIRDLVRVDASLEQLLRVTAFVMSPHSRESDDRIAEMQIFLREVGA